MQHEKSVTCVRTKMHNKHIHRTQSLSMRYNWRERNHVENTKFSEIKNDGFIENKNKFHM